MPRSRNIKPSLFKNELLGEADPVLTIVFIGLWTLADREGRLEDRPKRIKAEILPYRECQDFNGYLTELARLGFIRRYTAKNCAYIQVVNFKKHQAPHKTEKPSEIPEPPAESVSCVSTVKAPLSNGSATVKESLIPDSLIPDSCTSGSDGKPSPRRQDLLFESVAESCGLDWRTLPKTERGALNKAVKELRDIGTTPEQVRAKAAAYQQKWPAMTLTPMALVKNWGQITAEAARQSSKRGFVG